MTPLIREWRGLGPYKIKQANLAREAGIHVVTLSRIERGEMEPSIVSALRICSALSRLTRRKIHAEDVFFYSDDGSDAAWRALSAAEDENYRQAEQASHHRTR